MIRKICPSILFSYILISSSRGVLCVLGAGDCVGFCSSDSARGRFNDSGLDEILTGGVLVPFAGRVPSFVKGLSDGVGEDWLDGRMEILGLGAASEVPEVAGVEEREDDTGSPASPPEACAPCGFGGPASFSMRRLRILPSS